MAGGSERPNELFEEEFRKEATRLAAAKKGVGVPFEGEKAAADAANSDGRPGGDNGAAATATTREEGASSAAAAAAAAAAPPPP